MKRQNPMRYARKMGVVLGENADLLDYQIGVVSHG